MVLVLPAEKNVMLKLSGKFTWNSILTLSL